MYLSIVDLCDRRLSCTCFHEVHNELTELKLVREVTHFPDFWLAADIPFILFSHCLWGQTDFWPFCLFLIFLIVLLALNYLTDWKAKSCLLHPSSSPWNLIRTSVRLTGFSPELLSGRSSWRRSPWRLKGVVGRDSFYSSVFHYKFWDLVLFYWCNHRTWPREKAPLILCIYHVESQLKTTCLINTANLSVLY